MPSANESSIFDASLPSASKPEVLELLPERIEVTLKTADHDGMRGSIVEAGDDGTYEVLLNDKVERVRVVQDELELVRPAKKEKVVIVRGESRGTLGTLIGIDGQDGIVKMQNQDIRILSLQDVGRLTTD
eukprot:5692390-Pleurochrysis_carterae.AAC.1